MKIRHYIFLIASVLCASCTEDQQSERTMSPAQMELIGRAVNFNPSKADPFITRATYRRNGLFNEGDQMTIYRQYSNDGVNFDDATEAYRVYSYVTTYATGTSIELNTDWKPKEGAWGHNPDTEAYGTKRGDFQQSEGDSLTWENGKTVRFRAWSRSNLADAIRNNKDYYYPDYCVSDWVTVSGPTLDIPLTLKHQGCRIEFHAKDGNELVRAEICTEVEDYRWKDNNTVRDNDESASEHGKSLAQATAEANAVKAVYDKMCMPAGADMEHALLTALTQQRYNNNATNFADLTRYTTENDIVKIGTKSADHIREYVQRPMFAKNDRMLSMITIPYDMSNAVTSGESLTLPACTRIKIWLFDVNNGDRAQSQDVEGNYHIFTLSDIMNKAEGDDKTPLFPNGMELKAGYSYRFTVGYQYDHIDITPTDNFSWETQDAEDGTATNSTVAEITQAEPYKWWKEAIKKAIPKTIEQSYNPEFKISTPEEFLEFIKLVNGTAVVDAAKNGGLTQKQVVVGKDNQGKDVKEYRWYRTDAVNAGTWTVADSVTHAAAEAEGYIFYQHYHPRNADQPAYTIEDYLRKPYSFFDEDLNRRFTVKIVEDLDMHDWQLVPIGNEDPSVRLSDADSHPFRGILDGYEEVLDGDDHPTDGSEIHTLKNVYFRDGYMFRHCFDAAIRNLRIESTHPFMLLDTAEAKEMSTGYGAYIVGISIYAPSTGNPIARVLKGSSYVVGCLYQGHITLDAQHTNGAMVGEANNLNMYGNMMAATGLPHNTGALLGKYSDGSSQFFAPQTGKKLSWGNFMGNYYLMDRYSNTVSEVVHAVGTIEDKYLPQQYIRGALAWVLKAKNDNLLSSDVTFDQLTSPLMRKGYYGLAPWKAMNYALYQYNEVGKQVSEAHNCKGHFVNDDTGYANVFPHMVVGEPNSTLDNTGYSGNYSKLNFLKLNN